MIDTVSTYLLSVAKLCGKGGVRVLSTSFQGIFQHRVLM